ncbi:MULTISPECIES: hypothetical protein [unclassified Streptomyces]|uniref:hypothetical protein n=1 Tax=unclassified Streptomyces TaxID=2593676 RepID=UPI0035DD5571
MQGQEEQSEAQRDEEPVECLQEMGDGDRSPLGPDIPQTRHNSSVPAVAEPIAVDRRTERVCHDTAKICTTP